MQSKETLSDYYRLSALSKMGSTFNIQNQIQKKNKERKFFYQNVKQMNFGISKKYKTKNCMAKIKLTKINQVRWRLFVFIKQSASEWVTFHVNYFFLSSENWYHFLC